jgi:secondary thiamine-phosphate synthase enzyme
VPEGDRLYTHTAEGDDDMPAHVRAALTRTSEQVPVLDGELALGTWQAIYVWEHRRGAKRRELIVHVAGE